jgi:hypothetical protein
MQEGISLEISSKMGKIMGLIFTFLLIIALVPGQISAYFAVNQTGWSLPVIGVWSVTIIVFIFAVAKVLMDEL